MPNYPNLVQLFRQQFNHPRLNLTLNPLDESNLTQSKLGGIPYLEEEDALPHDLEGYPMRLLAQINYGQMAVHALKGFPQKGLIQFWISQTDPYFGRGPQIGSTGQKDWRILYYPEIHQSLTPAKIQSLMALNNQEIKPSFPLTIDQAYAIDFEKTIIPPLWNIYGSHQDVQAFLAPLSSLEQEGFKDEVFEQWDPYGSMIGGYPAFNDQDPRWQIRDWQGFDTVLLQLDSQGPIHWPDDGIGQFMIRREDLLNLNFNRVLYSWGS